MSPRHVFLGTEGFPPTVYMSQVAGLLSVLERELGLGFDVINFDPLYPKTQASSEGRQRVERFRQALPGGLRVLPYVPYEDRLGQPLARRLLRLALGPHPAVVHARGVWAASLCADLVEAGARLAYVYDVRGDYLAEHSHHRTGRGDDDTASTQRGRWRIRQAEARAARLARRILCVSEALRDRIQERYGEGRKVAVVPCSVDSQRFRLDEGLRTEWRRRLKLEDRRVLVYSGSLVSYQLPHTVARLGKLARAIEPTTHLLWLTPDPDTARKLSLQAGLPPEAFSCLHAKHADMPALLNAADVGLLLRRPDPVNAVASPTKAAEYLACGLALLVSRGIGDTSGWVSQHGVGAVVDDVEREQSLRAGIEALLTQPPARERVAAFAREHLARDRFLDTYQTLYADLAAGIG